MEINIDNFTLKQVKRQPNEGLVVKFSHEEKVGDEVFLNEDVRKYAKIPHPDLIIQLDRLVYVVANIFGYNSCTEGLVQADDFKATEEQDGFASNALEAIKGTIRVNGVTLTGSGETTAVIIMAVRTVGQFRIAMNTYPILLSGTSLGFEENVLETLGNIRKEAFEYVINGKYAQLDLAFAK